MTHPQPKCPPIPALVRDKGDQIDQLLTRAATRLQAHGLEIAGTVQQTHARQNGCCDDFSLRNLATGTCHLISQNLGPGSRGCRLDYDRIGGPYCRDRPSAFFDNRCDDPQSVWIQRKPGGGFRPLIERAIEMKIPLLIAVNRAYQSGKTTRADFQ